MNPYQVRQRIEKIEAQIALKKSEIADLQRDQQKMMAQVEKLKKMLILPAQKVTDHAVVRYLERAVGMDIEKLREDLKDTAEIAKRGRTPVVKNNTLITVK